MSEKPDTPSAPANAIVKSADMPEEMQAGAIEIALKAQEDHEIEKDIAAQIKKEADKRWGPTWHVVVGKSFGSYVTHTSGNFIYMYINQLAFLIFKAG